MDAIRRPKVCCFSNCTSYRVINEPKEIHFVKIENEDEDDSYTRYKIVEQTWMETYIIHPKDLYTS